MGMRASGIAQMPGYLRKRKQWVVRQGKVPLLAAAAKQDAPKAVAGDANDPTNLMSFTAAEECCARLMAASIAEAGIGYALTGDGEVIVFDFDGVLKDGRIEDARIANFVRDLASFTEISLSGRGLHVYVRVSKALKARMLERVEKVTKFAPDLTHSVYVGGGFVAATGNRFLGTPDTVNSADESVQRWFRARFPKQQRQRQQQQGTESTEDLDDDLTRFKVEDALSSISPDCDRDRWIKVGQVLHKLAQGDERGLRMWEEWSATAPHRLPKGREPSMARLYRSFKVDGELNLGTLIYMAKEERSEQPSTRKRSAKDRQQREQAEEHGGQSQVVVERLDSIKAKAIRWLMPDFLAHGVLTLLSGEAGAGKTTLLCRLTAHVTSGKRWPYGGGTPEPGDVLFLAAEDPIETVILPRLIAAGADRSRVHSMKGVLTGKDNRQRLITLEQDIGKLSEVLAQHKEIRMVIIDPITAYLGTRDSNSATAVRDILHQLQQVVEERDIVCVLVTHNRKEAGMKAINQILGSQAFGAAPRMVLMAGKPQREEEYDDPDLYIVAKAKSNIASLEKALAYKINKVTVSDGGVEIPTTKIEWVEVPEETTADDLVRRRPPTELEKAVKWLEEYMRPHKGKWVPAKQVEEAAAQEKPRAISQPTLNRASLQLGIDKQKLGSKDGGSTGWCWKYSPSWDALGKPQDLEDSRSNRRRALKR